MTPTRTRALPAGRLARLLAILVPLIGSTLVGAAPAPASAGSSVCTPDMACVTITDTPDPVAPSNSAGTPTYISYRATVTNKSSKEQKKTALIEVLPVGSAFVPSGSSAGCTARGRTVVCPIGTLAKGASAVRDVVATAPTTQGTAVNAVSITHYDFDEDDSASVNETTTVSDQSGSTYIPAGTKASVSTPPNPNQSGTVTVYPQTFSTTAKMSLLAPGQGPAFSCLLGQITIQDNLYPCRGGSWVLAEVPGTFNPPLEFKLRWSAAMSSLLQTESNFAVFYAPTATSQVQAITKRCTGQPGQTTPCLKDITHEADGGWSVVMVKPENGHMR